LTSRGEGVCYSILTWGRWHEVPEEDCIFVSLCLPAVGREGVPEGGGWICLAPNSTPNML